jgi:DNA-binding NtrC family response regulator
MNQKQPYLLIVDDEIDTCANLKDIFTDLGYQVDVAYDGLSALELVKTHHYDVALLDLKMPGMDGLELYRRIRQISACTVAVIVTAYATSETARAALAAGAWRILAKPVDFNQLLGLVGEALEQPLVLVVDDDQELCESLWDLFREHSYRTCLAHNIREADQSLKQQQHNVVLIDMKLPEGHGGDVLRLVHEGNPSARTIVITGYRGEMEELVQQAVASGADAVCYKPFDVKQLLSTVKQLEK